MYLVFDIGGTHIRLAVSSNGKSFDGAPVIVDTPKKWDDAVKLLTDLCAKQEKPDKVCVAIAGEFDLDRASLVFSPNLNDWVGKPLRKLFEDATGAPVMLFNDAIAAAVAEAREGAGKGYSIVAYLTVGTGVGGARIVDGKVDENRQGFEPGQHIIDSGSGETLEMRVSGSGFIRRFGLDFVETAPNEAWEMAAHELAVGVYNTLDFWSPDVVVVGGSMILKPHSIPLTVVVKYLSTLVTSGRKIPPFVKAEFGDESGLRGALLLAQE